MTFSASAALDSAPDVLLDFLNVGQHRARDEDNRVKTAQIMAVGGA
jgi:hypothetical protein